MSTPRDPEIPAGLTYQLRFEQYKLITSLSFAAAGGVLVLLEAGLLRQGLQSNVTLIVFAVAASCALLGRDRLVTGLEAGKGRTREARWLLSTAILSLGVGLGMLVQIVL